MVYPHGILNNYKAFEKVVQYETDCSNQKANLKAASGVPPGEAALLFGGLLIFDGLLCGFFGIGCGHDTAVFNPRI